MSLLSEMTKKIEEKRFIPLLSEIYYQSVWFKKKPVCSSYDEIVPPAKNIPQIAKSPKNQVLCNHFTKFAPRNYIDENQSVAISLHKALFSVFPITALEHVQCPVTWFFQGPHRTIIIKKRLSAYLFL